LEKDCLRGVPATNQFREADRHLRAQSYGEYRERRQTRSSLRNRLTQTPLLKVNPMFKKMRLPEIKHLATKTVLAVQPEVNVPEVIPFANSALTLTWPAS
jgi:hypothetical protein